MRDATSVDLLDLILRLSEAETWPPGLATGWSLYCEARDRGLVETVGGDDRVGELLRELIEDDSVTCRRDSHPRGMPPPGVPWGSEELQRCSAIRLTRLGRQEARAARRDRAGWPADARLRDAARRLDEPVSAALLEQAATLRRTLDDRPAATVGAAKDLVEAAAKTLLAARGEAIPTGMTLPRLVTLALRAADPGSTSPTALARSLTATSQALGEWRNQVGAGHGRTEPDSLDVADAHLAADAALAVAAYLVGWATD